MDIQDFDFELPPEQIAQAPVAQRDRARLMIVDRQQQRITHDVFANLGAYLRPGDVCVVNNTRVIPARLRGHKAGSGGKVEVLLLHEHSAGAWDVLLKPAAKTRLGTTLVFGDGLLHAQVVARNAEGTMRVHFTPPHIYEQLAQCGEVPLPPYIKRPEAAHQPTPDRERYQTVYAMHPGAVAAPTAGLHFTPELLERLAAQGIQRAEITLHVGWGTFQPLRTTVVEAHQVAKEFYRVEAPAIATVQAARARGSRVIAVGTTTTRTLETLGAPLERWSAHTGWSDLYIYPGFRFQVVDGLLTNFHLPRSSLFVLVCAFAGRECMLEAYRQAIAAQYRFYSYGDAMLIQ